MTGVVVTLALGLGAARTAQADGQRRMQGPNPFTEMSGVWVLEYKTVFSSCPGRVEGDVQTSVWTIIFRDNRYVATNAERAQFLAQPVDGQNRLLFTQAGMPRSNSIRLWFTGPSTLAGRRWLAQPVKGVKSDPACVIYDEITAKRQGAQEPRRR